MNSGFNQYSSQLTNAAPLAVFRILFGIMMLGSVIRFWANGWIEQLYLKPDLFFSYQSFEWVQPLGSWTYGLFVVCGIAAIGVALGYRYKFSSTMFFLSFTYIELMDKTTYLNHYYFVSVLSFLMIWLPANATFSLDAWRNPKLRFSHIPRWTIDSIKLLLAIVYVYAGLAKLNSDWLFDAQPLTIWLASKTNLPLIGGWMRESWVAYAFSWFGAVYDLSIPFFLLYKKTRPYAFVVVVVFHVMTRILFPIGMFPFIMIVSTLIFFDPSVHLQIWNFLAKGLKISNNRFFEKRAFSPLQLQNRVSRAILIPFLVCQLLIPFRYLVYPGELFWTEEGFRFSWRVMLMEKAGYANFKIMEPSTGKRFYVDNREFLTAFQEKQMSFQPDFILEFAHYLGNEFSHRGVLDPEIYVESFVALNGRGSQPFVDPEINLLTIHSSQPRMDWLLPFEDEISGL